MICVHKKLKANQTIKSLHMLVQIFNAQVLPGSNTIDFQVSERKSSQCSVIVQK